MDSEYPFYSQRVGKKAKSTILGDTVKSDADYPVRCGILGASLATLNLPKIYAFEYDPSSSKKVKKYKISKVLHHMRGTPDIMQINPKYKNVLLDIYDYLKEKIAEAERTGISRKRIIIDPGIGFGKSFSHNMEIIKKASLFLGLGCPLMIGVSRKSFIGEIISERLPSARLSGSIAAMLKIVSNGVNIVRVHDVKETVDAMKVWNIFK